MDLRPTHQFDPWSADAARLGGAGINFDDIDFTDPASVFKAIGGGGLGGLPIPKAESPDSVRREAKERRDSIFASYAKLHDILKRHEDTIQKRWAKKKKAQRLQILLKAWPNMAPSHRPDFEAFLKESEQQRMRGTKYRDWFIWPYINQEDLSRPRLLPLLLNSRGRHHPCTFAGIDATNTKFAFVTKAVVPIFLNEYTMILNGVDEKHPDDYGKLVSWDEHPSNFELAMSQRQFLPGEGLLVLEVQDRLLSFLVKCCTEILHEIPQDQLLSTKYPVQPEPHMKDERETAGFDSLAVLAAEAPYRVPAKLDFGRIESLLGAQAAACEDHLWSLREDPNYFVDKALELEEHRLENLKDYRGRPHSLSQNEAIFWSRILGSLVNSAYMEVEVYNELHRQADQLRVLQEKYANVISVKDDLPKEYLKALLKFRFYLNQATKGVLGQLKQSALSSPPMRNLAVRTSGAISEQSMRDLGTDMIGAEISRLHKMTPVEKRLMWLLRTLWEDGMDLFLASQPIIVDELERLLETEKEASNLISSYVAGLIGQLSIITQCMKQLDCYQPWARSFETLNIDYEDGIRESFAETSKPWAAILRATGQQGGWFSSLVRLGKPTGKRFFYPIDKRRTKENVEALRSAESNLDDFWKGVDRIMYKHANNLENTFVRRLLAQSRSLQRTPEWVEPSAPTTNEKGAKPAVADVDDLIIPFSSFFFGLPASPQSEPIPAPKTKVKTRGTAATPTEPTTMEQPPTSDTAEDKQPTFAVDAKSIKVFRTLFYNPNVTSSPGEIPWSDFLHAMTSTGFMAEKLYGSVWQFRPTNLDVERAIQFHEPHPKGKLTFMMARRIGRRLNRAYGWIGSMFVPEK